MPKSIVSVFKQLIYKVTHIFMPSTVGSEVHGIVKFFDKKKGFGFIVAEGKDYFFNTAATNPTNFRALKEGVAVKFLVAQGKKGLQAKKIEVI